MMECDAERYQSMRKPGDAGAARRGSRLVRSIALSLFALLAGCSRGEPLTATSGANGNDPFAADCINEFVQEYAEVAEQPAGEIPAGLCFAEGSSPEGPPKYPTSSRHIRIEYRRGEYFATQDSASWTYDEEPDIARGCIVAKLVRTRIVAISEGGRVGSVHIEDGKLLRSSETGDDYSSSLGLGSAFSDRNVVPGYRMSVEATPFGLDCSRAVREGDVGTSICSFVQPHTCRSVRSMAPAELRLPNATGGAQIGRTTRFQTGAVTDQSTWVLP
jgi:hypothetical protein